MLSRTASRTTSCTESRTARRPGRALVAALPVLLLPLLPGCAQMQTAYQSAVDWVSGSGPSAVAALSPTQGNSAAGTVRFTQKGTKVAVVADLHGLPPGAEFGFHVHEKGDCSAPDASSAGGHFNPSGKPHGMHTQPERHAGDMPNLKSDAQGNAHAEWDSDLLAVGSGTGDVVGRAVVVHRNADDYHSQPAGNSGPRIACGVIKAS